jgi:hypothetical protein
VSITADVRIDDFDGSLSTPVIPISASIVGQR